MSQAPYPENETERLRALRALQLLNSGPDEVLDDLSAITAHVCRTPVALVSLVDQHRQWFLARVGTTLTGTPREHAFCAYTILESTVFEVPDTLADRRFADNPLVHGPPGIRYYAGVRLVTAEQLSIGALCVIDTKPRRLTNEQLEALRMLGRVVVSHIELRRSALELAGAHVKRYAATRDGPAQRVLVVDDDRLTQTLLRHFLATQGFAVTVAPHGSDALKHLCARDVDVILLDRVMPDMDGLATLHAIRAVLPGQRYTILMLTSTVDPMWTRKCQALGVRGFIAKPLDADALVTALADAGVTLPTLRA